MLISSHPVYRMGSPTFRQMKGFLIMSKTADTPKTPARDDRLHVPTKAEIMEALLNDSSRGGLQLEWMLDRRDMREGQA